MDWTSATPARRVTVRFLDDEGRTVSHWNKLLKGSLVRWLLTEQPAGPEDLSGFQHTLGYRFDARSSALDATLAAVALRQGCPAGFRPCRPEPTSSTPAPRFSFNPYPILTH